MCNPSIARGDGAWDLESARKVKSHDDTTAKERRSFDLRMSLPSRQWRLLFFIFFNVFSPASSDSSSTSFGAGPKPLVAYLRAGVCQ